jgi:repressor LexA
MLSKRQNAVLGFVRDQQSRTGLIPATREIQKHFRYKSQTSVQDILNALERKGALERNPRKARSLVLSSFTKRPALVDIPIYGTIPAGIPSDQEQEKDGCITVDIDSLKIPKNARTFALKVRGDSMIDAHIQEGDTVILEFKEARNRDIVAALIDGDTTLKRYVVQRGKPFLKAENPKFPDLIPAQELVIQGVMIGLFRTAR